MAEQEPDQLGARVAARAQNRYPKFVGDLVHGISLSTA
jgi:hypothetical protein